MYIRSDFHLCDWAMEFLLYRIVPYCLTVPNSGDLNQNERTYRPTLSQPRSPNILVFWLKRSRRNPVVISLNWALNTTKYRISDDKELTTVRFVWHASRWRQLQQLEVAAGSKDNIGRRTFRICRFTSAVDLGRSKRRTGKRRTIAVVLAMLRTVRSVVFRWRRF